MASLGKRNDSWLAEIRLKGYPSQIQSSQSQTVAKACARKIASSIDSGHGSIRGSRDFNSSMMLLQRKSLPRWLLCILIVVRIKQSRV